jgi:Flp pilus assembly pilin Flp
MPSPIAVATLLRIANRTKRLRSLDEGQDLLEYGLLAALIAIVALGAVTAVGQTVYTVFWKSIQTNF